MAQPHYRIVVGVGFTDACKHAVIEALALAARIPGTEVHATTVLDANLDSSSRIAKAAERLAEAETKLVDFVKSAAAAASAPKTELPIQYHVRIGKPVEALNQVAFDVDASLIVVGTRARSRAAKLLLGSVAESLLREGRFPVLVARPSDTSGMTRSPKPDPRRPGEALTADRDSTLSSSDRIDFGGRPSHISGLV